MIILKYCEGIQNGLYRPEKALKEMLVQLESVLKRGELWGELLQCLLSSVTVLLIFFLCAFNAIIVSF